MLENKTKIKVKGERERERLRKGRNLKSRKGDKVKLWAKIERKKN